MPLFTYRCGKCGLVSDLLVGVTADSRVARCPSCGSKELKKMLSTFNVGKRSSPAKESPAGTCSAGKCPTCF